VADLDRLSGAGRDEGTLARPRDAHNGDVNVLDVVARHVGWNDAQRLKYTGRLLRTTASSSFERLVGLSPGRETKPPSSVLLSLLIFPTTAQYPQTQISGFERLF